LSGTFGLETETKVKSAEFPDGRPAPGVETTQHRPPSYFGLSISVPTNDKQSIVSPSRRRLGGMTRTQTR
jgi:hypothetical protein